VDWPTADSGALELARRLRGREAVDGVPYTWLLVTPPPSGRAHVPAALDAGVDAFLVKPVDPTALQAALVAARRCVNLRADLLAARAELARRDEQLREEGRRDPLTRLGSRVRLDEDLRRVRNNVHRYRHRWTAVMIEPDQFRRYAETMGREAADDVLRRMARAVRRTLRDGDLAYRYAGARFLLLLPEQDEDGGVVVAHRCRSAVAALAIPHPRSDVGERVTLSAGVAELRGAGADDLEDWLRRADLALYAAQAAGRNGVARGGHTHLAGTGVEA
jgi:diguanylate cyclase (GGDEF)-like protein